MQNMIIIFHAFSSLHKIGISYPYGTNIYVFYIYTIDKNTESAEQNVWKQWLGEWTICTTHFVVENAIFARNKLFFIPLI